MREVGILLLLICLGITIAEAPRRYDEWAAAERQRHIDELNAQTQRVIQQLQAAGSGQGSEDNATAQWRKGAR